MGGVFINTKMIAFDLFGVVFTEGHMVSGTLMPLLREQGLSEGLDKKQVKGFYNQYTNGQIEEAAFWRGIGVDDYSRLRDEFLHSFVLDDGLLTVLESLSDRFAFSILSNLASDWADTLIAKFDFKSTFDPIVISGKVGVGKPDKRIYQVLIERSDVDANEMVFIDDRLENLVTANTFGMKTIHFQREADGFDFEPDYVISDMKELIALL